MDIDFVNGTAIKQDHPDECVSMLASFHVQSPTISSTSGECHTIKDEGMLLFPSLPFLFSVTSQCTDYHPRRVKLSKLQAMLAHFRFAA
jgi:hypothetical protein